MSKEQSEENKEDLLTSLPDELKLRIFSFLDYKSLGRVAQVSKNLYSLAYDEMLIGNVFLVFPLWLIKAIDYRVISKTQADKINNYLNRTSPFTKELPLPEKFYFKSYPEKKRLPKRTLQDLIDLELISEEELASINILFEDKIRGTLLSNYGIRFLSQKLISAEEVTKIITDSTAIPILSKFESHLLDYEYIDFLERKSEKRSCTIS